MWSTREKQLLASWSLHWTLFKILLINIKLSKHFSVFILMVIKVRHLVFERLHGFMEGKKSFGKHLLNLTVLNFSHLITTLSVFLKENLSFPHHHFCLHHHSDSLSHCSCLLGLSYLPSLIPLDPSFIFFCSTNHTSPMSRPPSYTTLFTIQPDTFSPLSLADLTFPLGLLPALLTIRLPLSDVFSRAPPLALAISLYVTIIKYMILHLL